jgi:hypothetical protein
VPPVLGLTEATVNDLQLVVLARRWKCTTTEGGILLPQSLDMLLEEGHPHMLLDDGLDGVPLQVEHVLHVLSYHSHAGMEVRTL